MISLCTWDGAGIYASDTPATPASMPFETQLSMPAFIHRVCFSWYKAFFFSSSVASGQHPGAICGGMSGWTCMTVHVAARVD